MIEVNGLREEFGDLVAEAGVSFACAKGEIFGLLAPNGSVVARAFQLQ